MQCEELERLGGRNNYNIWAMRQQFGSESFKGNDNIQTRSARLDAYNQRLSATGSELSELERLAWIEDLYDESHFGKDLLFYRLVGRGLMGIGDLYLGDEAVKRDVKMLARIGGLE